MISYVSGTRAQELNQQRGQGPLQRAEGWCVEFLVTILRGHQTCPAIGSNPGVRDETRITLLVDPRKATKGRRMSKKTRKKSSTKPSKTIVKKATQKATTAKASRGGSKAPAKKPAARAGKAVAKKSGKPANRASAKASHTPASKPLKSEQSVSPKFAIER